MSSIDNLKHAMGWQHPTLRDRCTNCLHSEVSDGLRFSRPELRCTKGGFFTHPNAVCKQHEKDAA